jgi:hypothetical protein
MNYFTKTTTFFVTVFLSTAVYGWQSTITNSSDGQILVTVSYAGGGAYEDRTITVNAGASGTILAPGGLHEGCAQTVTVRSTSGTAVGKTVSVETQRAGINMTCANFVVEVSNSTTNSTDLIVTNRVV